MSGPNADWLGAELVPRYYQQDAADKVFGSFAQGNKRVLIQMATGMGKTPLIAEVARRWEGRVLVIAHRNELIDQARKTLREWTGEWVDLEKGEFRSYRSRLVVSSVQTLSRQSEDYRGEMVMRRLARLQTGGPITLVIVDEAHRAVSPSYRRLLDELDCHVLGVTATSDRTDGRAMGLVFDDSPFRMDIKQGVGEGWLVKPMTRHVSLDEIDLQTVKASRNEGGLNLGELDEAMVKAIEHICQDTMRYEPERQGICFFPGVRSAELAAMRFNQLLPDSAICITGETDPDERRAMVEGYKRGDYMYLCNCQVATEGFDAPATSMVVMGRPTTSRMLYTQMSGRCTRPLPGLVDLWPGRDQHAKRRGAIASSHKPGAVLLDFVGNAGKHSLVSMIDLLDGDYSDEEVKRAKEIEEERDGEEIDPEETLKQARAELEALAAETKKLKARIKSTSKVLDPFEVFGVKLDGHENFDKKPASKGQLAMLAKAGVDPKLLNGIDFRNAQKLVRTVMKRRQLGLCSFGALAQLQRLGIKRKNVGRENAAKAMAYLKQTGWGKRTDLDKLNTIVQGDV